MNLSGPFIARPVATTLLTLGVALAGMMGYRLLPVAPLPQVEFPTISVQAALPGPAPRPSRPALRRRSSAISVRSPTSPR